MNNERLDALLELEKRNKLPADYAPILTELRRRGKIQSPDDPSFFGAAARGARDGVTFGLYDEGSAALQASYKKLVDGEDYSENYSRIQQEYQDQLDKDMEMQPGGFYLGNIAGSVAMGGGIGIAAGATRAGANAIRAVNAGSKMARAGKAAGIGAGVGAFEGANTSSQGNRTSGAMTGAALGGVFGAAAPAVGDAVKAGVRGVKNFRAKRASESVLDNTSGTLLDKIGRPENRQAASLQQDMIKQQLREIQQQPELYSPDNITSARNAVSELSNQGISPELNDAFGGAFKGQQMAARGGRSHYVGAPLQEIDDARNKQFQNMIDGRINTPFVKSNSETGGALKKLFQERQEALRKDALEKAKPYYDAAKYQDPFFYKPASDNASTTMQSGFDPERALQVAQGKISSEGAKQYQRPLIQSLMQSGGIEPNSQIAQELYASGVTPKTAPGLFRQGGVKSFDNIPTGEFDNFNIQAENGYYDQNSIIDRLRAEITPSRGGNSDMFTQDAGRDAIKRELNDLGVSTNAAPEELQSALEQKSRDDIYNQSLQAESMPADMSDGVPYEKIFDETARFRTLSPEILQDPLIKKYAEEAGEKYYTLIDKDSPLHSIDRMLHVRERLDGDINRALQNQDNTMVAHLSAVRDNLNSKLKSDPNIAQADDFYQKMYSQKEVDNTNRMGRMASQQDATSGQLVSQLFQPSMTDKNQFMNIVNALPARDREEILRSHAKGLYSNVSEEGLDTLYNKTVGKPEIRERLEILAGGQDTDAYNDVVKTLDITKYLKGSKAQYRGSPTAHKIDADNTAMESADEALGIWDNLRNGNLMRAGTKTIGKAADSIDGVTDKNANVFQKRNQNLAYQNFYVNPQNTNHVIDAMEQLKPEQIDEIVNGLGNQSALARLFRRGLLDGKVKKIIKNSAYPLVRPSGGAFLGGKIGGQTGGER